MALADIDRDGWRDLVLANGVDLSPQSLIVHRNRGASAPGGLERYPTWYSSDIDHHGGLAVGDIDGDGWLDAAVAVPFDHHRKPHTGCVRVYLNDGKGELQKAASYSIGLGFQVLDVALGDIDGDGRLDLAAAGVGAYDPGTKVPLETAQQRIHMNRGGRLEGNASWTTEESMAAATVAFADVNQDGRLDLVLGSRRIGVYYGRADATNPLARVPDWQSEATHTAVYGLDVGRLSAHDTTLSIVAGDNCRTRKCDDSKVYLYRPSAGAAARWSMPADNASRVLLVNANGDAHRDLVAAQLGAGEHGAELLIVPGVDDGFASAHAFRSTERFLGISMASGDLRHSGLITASWVGKSDGTVVTLPDRQLEAIDSVVVNDKVLGSRDWSWVPGEDWLAISRAVPRGNITVHYRWSPVADVVQASMHGVGAGTAVFLSRYAEVVGRPPTPPAPSAATEDVR